MKICATFMILMLCVGCSTTVRPEVKPIDPVPVFLTDYGIHSSLMLPTPDGRYVEYSFGDYSYAVLNQDWPHDAIRALFASGQSGIGRRFLTIKPGEDMPRPAYGPTRSNKFFADRKRVYSLVRDLDERYRAGRDEPLMNPVTSNVFVKDTERYSIANNCNHMTKRMLEQLGCEVNGFRGMSWFKVVGKQQIPPPIPLTQVVHSRRPAAVPPRQPVRKSPAESGSLTQIDMD